MACGRALSDEISDLGHTEEPIIPTARQKQELAVRFLGMTKAWPSSAFRIQCERRVLHGLPRLSAFNASCVCWRAFRLLTNPSFLDARPRDEPAHAIGPERDSGVALMPPPLTVVQEQVLDRLFRHTLSEVDAALVLIGQGPAATGHQNSGSVVFVSDVWQHITGLRAEDVVGRDDWSACFAAHGPQTDPSVLAAISAAMAAGRACKALMVSYRQGDVNQPFWNMLSISPIVHKGELIFYLANLLDYTTQMRSVAEPRGFCRSSAFHQRCTPLLPPALQPGQSDRMFATPAVFEAVDSQTPRPDMHPAVSANTAQPPRLQPRIRRLGWFGLTLEPEHLEQRIVAGVPDVKAARHF